MRENHKMMALTAILAAGVVLAGCGATNSAASSGFCNKYSVVGSGKNRSTADAGDFTE